MEDEDTRLKTMAETMEREKAASAAVRNLRQTIKDDKASHEDYMSTKKTVMGECKEELKVGCGTLKSVLKSLALSLALSLSLFLALSLSLSFSLYHSLSLVLSPSLSLTLPR